MRLLILFFLLTPLIWSCEEEQNPSKSYLLYQAGFTPTNGEVEVTDMGGGKLKVEIALKPFFPGKYPAHLHFGDIQEVGELAIALNDVDGETGIGRTVLDNVRLSNGEVLTYTRFLEMNASVKIHMNSITTKHLVIAYGNVGKNDNYFATGVTVCVGH